LGLFRRSAPRNDTFLIAFVLVKNVSVKIGLPIQFKKQIEEIFFFEIQQAYLRKGPHGPLYLLKKQGDPSRVFLYGPLAPEVRPEAHFLDILQNSPRKKLKKISN
jgi:hypothetical protein